MNELVIKEEPKNNFKDYGFEADFGGEILKELLDKSERKIYIGYYIGDNDVKYPCIWDSFGECGFCCSAKYKNRNLRKIIPKWFENPDNFEAYKGKLITNKHNDIRKIEYIYNNCVDVGIECIYHEDLIVDEWQLVTKEDIKQLIFDGDE